MGRGFGVLGALTRVIPEAPPGPIDASHIHNVLIVKLSLAVPEGDVVAAAVPGNGDDRRLAYRVDDWRWTVIEPGPER